MNKFWTKFIIDKVLRQQQENNDGQKKYSSYQIAKGFRELKLLLIRYIWEPSQTCLRLHHFLKHQRIFYLAFFKQLANFKWVDTKNPS